MTDELQDRVHPAGAPEPFTGFRFEKPIFTDGPTSDSEAPHGVSSPFLGVASAAPPHDLQPTAQPLASTFALERRPRVRQKARGVLDWVAFVLAFLLPPLGVLAAVAAIIVGIRGRGWAAGISKAAVAVGLVLSLALAGGGVVLARNANTAAAHAAIVTSSAKWCAAIQKDPATLASATYGWPRVGGTIATSLPAMKVFTARWGELVKIAPGGIKAETQKILSASTAITTSVETSRVLDDSANVARMQQAVSSSGIPAWVAEFCN